MIKANPTSLLKEELNDLLFDIWRLNDISIELQYNERDMSKYRGWLKQTLAYTITARKALGVKDDVVEQVQIRDIEYCDILDLRRLTNNALDNYSSSLLAYANEVDEETRQLLFTIMFGLAQMKFYARR
jgi:hypothetical protein